MAIRTARQLPALKVHQWLAEWGTVVWDAKQRRAEPPHWFYQFSISATDLKSLSGIYPRSTKRSRGAEDVGIQRRHEPKRSATIAKYVEFGYPWCDLKPGQRESEEFVDLRKPGWLPTAIIVNIHVENDVRRRKRIVADDLVKVQDKSDTATIVLPKSFSGSKWRHSSIPPIEVIDGQHRLWAFEESDFNGDFELPVVAFVGLDVSWQAYLFYTINIKPKKINPSLAFDLYPLLRTEDWLTKFEGPKIYRETRAQELVDLLWSHPKSPWHHRINMLGEPGHKGSMITQAAWVRSLLATYVKSWENPKIGGLFGTPIGEDESALPWSRIEQGAFLIVVGQYLKACVKTCKDKWAMELRKQNDGADENHGDPAFQGSHTLLNQDQGLRVLLNITNDICFIRSESIELQNWGGECDADEIDEDQVTESIHSLRKNKRVAKFLQDLTKALASYDWRASSAPGMTEPQRIQRAAFRGSGGYKELRRDVLRHLSRVKGDIGTAANDVLRILGY